MSSSGWGMARSDYRAIDDGLGVLADVPSASGGCAMYVACSTLCFSKLALEDALRTIREMHFPKADLAIHASGKHLTPAEVAEDVGKAAQRLKAANLPLAAFNVEIDHPHTPVAITELRAVCRLARVLAVPLISIPAASTGTDFDAEVNRLQSWVKVAESEGTILSIETRSGTLTGDPTSAAELCRRVPGLGLTLDPSHYMVGPGGHVNYDMLFPYVRHVRLRDTGSKPEQFQVRVGQGEIEYGRIISRLDRQRYNRALSVDVRDGSESPFPVEPETRKLKFLLESLV